MMVDNYLDNKIDKSIVNDVVHNRLPDLRKAATEMLKRYPEDSITT